MHIAIILSTAQWMKVLSPCVTLDLGGLGLMLPEGVLSGIALQRSGFNGKSSASSKLLFFILKRKMKTYS